jgi:hypothetical protein
VASVTQSRTLVLAAVSAGLLYLAGAIALGSPPTAADSPAAVAGWFADHRDAARTDAWTATFGTLALAVFAGIVRELLPSPHRNVFLLGAAAFIIETVVAAWVWGGLALHPGLDAATARTVYDVELFWGPVLTGATMTMIGSVTVLGFGSRPSIPRWLAVLGLIAFVEQAIETITVFGTSGFTAPGGDMNLTLGAGLTLLWLAGLTVWAARRLAAAPSAQAAA